MKHGVIFVPDTLTYLRSTSVAVDYYIPLKRTIVEK